MAEDGAAISAACGSAASGIVTEKREPRPRRELELHLVAKQAAEPVDDGEAKAEPFPAIRIGTRELVELAEDALTLVLADAGAGIAHIDAQLIAAAAAADHHAASLRIAYGIGDEVFGAVECDREPGEDQMIRRHAAAGAKQAYDDEKIGASENC